MCDAGMWQPPLPLSSPSPPEKRASGHSGRIHSLSLFVFILVKSRVKVRKTPQNTRHVTPRGLSNVVIVKIYKLQVLTFRSQFVLVKNGKSGRERKKKRRWSSTSFGGSKKLHHGICSRERSSGSRTAGREWQFDPHKRTDLHERDGDGYVRSPKIDRKFGE